MFESVLRDHVRRRPEAQLRRGTELLSVDVSDDGVTAVLLDRASGARRRVAARYLIAADGARSGVRRRLGISMEGPEDLGSQHLIAFRAGLTRWTGRRPRGIYFLTTPGAALIWTHPDDRWVLNVRDTGSHLDPKATILDALGTRELPVEVLVHSRWTAAAQTAARYAHGPVFLVGDAAHRFPPIGAVGMSTAMADAHNLAWKLAAVLAGRARPGLLDTYAHERQAVGRDNAEETGTARSQLWRPTGRPFAGRSLRQLDLGGTAPPPSSPLPPPTTTPTLRVPTTGPPPRPDAGPRTCGPTPAVVARRSTSSTASSCCSPATRERRGVRRWNGPRVPWASPFGTTR